MQIRTIAKGIIGTITSIGVSMVIEKLIDANLPEEETQNNKWIAIANIILITTGKTMISGMLSSATKNYTDDMVDDLADVLLRLRKAKI